MLTGDLSDFSVRDLLDFLAEHRKSGVLQINSAAHRAGVVLRDGEVLVALFDLDRPLLAARLVALGLLDVDALLDDDDDAVTTARQLLIGQHGRRVAEVCAEHTVEAIGWMTQLAVATVTFDGQVAVEYWPFGGTTVTDVLSQVEARLDEWEELSDVITRSSSTPVLLPPPDTNVSCELDCDHWGVIAYVDGRRTLREITELCGFGPLETYRRLGRMIDKGLIELVPPGARSEVSSTITDVRQVQKVTRAWLRVESLPSLRDQAGSASAFDIGGALGSAAGMGPDADIRAPVDAGQDAAMARSARAAATAGDTGPAEPSVVHDVTPTPDVAAHETGIEAANRGLFDRLMGGGDRE